MVGLHVFYRHERLNHRKNMAKITKIIKKISQILPKMDLADFFD